MEKERWISEPKAIKIFGISQKKLAELEKLGKIKTIRTSGERKMYLFSDFLSEGMRSMENKNFLQKTIFRFISWFRG